MLSISYSLSESFLILKKDASMLRTVTTKKLSHGAILMITKFIHVLFVPVYTQMYIKDFGEASISFSYTYQQNFIMNSLTCVSRSATCNVFIYLTRWVNYLYSSQVSFKQMTPLKTCVQSATPQVFFTHHQTYIKMQNKIQPSSRATFEAFQAYMGFCTEGEIQS